MSRLLFVLSLPFRVVGLFFVFIAEAVFRPRRFFRDLLSEIFILFEIRRNRRINEGRSIYLNNMW